MRLETATETSFAAIDPLEFIGALEPSLSVGNFEAAIVHVRSRWTPAQVAELLKNKSVDVRKVAALSLALVGDSQAVAPLAYLLHDPDLMVVQMAEHALWSIWFRIGKPAAVGHVKCGNQHMHHGNYECAVEKFTRAVHEDEHFAEAYNQRAIAQYLSDRIEDSIADCKKALEFIPQHFGAMSGMGHCYAQLGQWRNARQCYRLALAIHPRLEGIAASLQHIDHLLRENPAA